MAKQMIDIFIRNSDGNEKKRISREALDKLFEESLLASFALEGESISLSNEKKLHSASYLLKKSV
ncbi:hypothetical protein [Yersinia aldovae]|uniref:hypothetical protein n=1 Tax=Yersinia aldovae TaxID=29483 RepID=UPI00066FB9C5|nr:hypothetical protein [Yersinia aldovae]HDL7749461.1 hypothetical protein [Yersinia enterocolitica]